MKALAAVVWHQQLVGTKLVLIRRHQFSLGDVLREAQIVRVGKKVGVGGMDKQVERIHWQDWSQ